MTSSQQFVALMNRIERANDWINTALRTYSPPRACCPACSCPGYVDEVDKQRRRIQWLSQLLAKRIARGAVGFDNDRAQYLIRMWWE